MHGARCTSQLWPAGSGGATNAYLVLLGPSPGGATGAKRYPRNIGPESMGFEWGGRRNSRWIQLCTEILGDECRARALTALLNLDSRHTTNERNISEAALREGWEERIFPLLSSVQPRIICALTNRVWNIITDGELGDPEVASFGKSLARQPVLLQIPGCKFRTLAVKPENHPARFLSNRAIRQLGRACRRFIEEVT